MADPFHLHHESILHIQEYRDYLVSYTSIEPMVALGPARCSCSTSLAQYMVSATIGERKQCTQAVHLASSSF